MDPNKPGPSSSNQEGHYLQSPLVAPSTSKSTTTNPTGLSPNLGSSPKKLMLGPLQDANRKSAFLPYRQTSCTVLTNLQRGNTQAETPIPLASEMDFHMRAGQGELKQHEIDAAGPDSVNQYDSNGLAALHWAAGYGQLHTCKLLLDNGAEVDRPAEGDGETPLIFAASGGHHEIIRLLISRGADVNATDHVCNTALMFAAKGNHPHSCHELLVHGANAHLQNMNDDTAHTLAVENNATLAQAVITNFLIAELESL